MIKVIVVVIAIVAQISGVSQNIFLDEKYSDWELSMIVFEDSEGDGQSNDIDIKKIWMANDQTYIYLRFDLGLD